MKRYSCVYIVLALFSMLVFGLSTEIRAAETQSITGWLAANDQPVYEVPEEKQQKWQSLQTLVKKEYNDCVEDCGNDDACLKRCEDVSKFRLDREYKKLMSE